MDPIVASKEYAHCLEEALMRVEIGVNRRLTLNDAKLIASGRSIVSMSPDSFGAMNNSYSFLRSSIDKRIPIYGINTQFGDQVNLLDEHLDHSEELYRHSIIARQENLIKSHACGAGDYAPIEVVKVAMALRANCLSKGYSGINPATVEAVLTCLNAGITPLVPRYGSIGASGDLIPLAAIASALIGEDVDVIYKGKLMRAPQAFEEAGIPKLQPEIRDGLALINGTSFMTAIASLALYDLKRLFVQMLAAIAMALESMLVINSAYHPLVHQLKGQSGENEVNNFLNDFWQGSQLLTDLDELREHYDNTSASSKAPRPLQDYYSLRSVPQGFGPFQENLARAVTWIENEMNSVNDNPIMDVANKKIHHGANFMGYYVTDTCDILKMNIAQASTWLHALLANMVHPRKNHDLPTNLVSDPTKYSGFRPIQLLAASLAVQNRKLAQSHQAYMLPTEGDNQDVNSLGTHAAFDFRESVANLERLTAVIFLASAQALELRGIKKASTKSQQIYQIIRSRSATLIDRPMTEEINVVVHLLKAEEI